MTQRTASRYCRINRLRRVLPLLAVHPCLLAADVIITRSSSRPGRVGWSLQAVFAMWSQRGKCRDGLGGPGGRGTEVPALVRVRGCREHRLVGTARSPVGLSRQELAGMLRATYRDASPNTIANNAGQVWNFVNTIALGDLVVVPLKASRSFRVRRVVGPAEHRGHLPELAAVRPVEWEAGQVASQALAADLRNALGSIMTVFRPRVQAAERRRESVVKDGRDPGPDSRGTTCRAPGYSRPTRSGSTCCGPCEAAPPIPGR
jgi:hypothetical protein